jgi:hypothetical protein
MQKPLIILPCSQEKLSVPARAINLYQGKGYLPLLSKSTASVGIDYDLAILSAKYGLIHANEMIEPYEQKLEKDAMEGFIKSNARKANALIRKLNPTRIITCLPKLYLNALTSMINENNALIELKVPPEGAGIGSQRGFLASALKALEPNYLDIFFFGKTPSGRLENSVFVRIRPGTKFRPWLRNDVENAYSPVYGDVVTAEKFISDGNGQRIVDTNGNKWRTDQFKFGLDNGFSDFISTYLHDNVERYTDDYQVIEFSELESKFFETFDELAA